MDFEWIYDKQKMKLEVRTKVASLLKKIKLINQTIDDPKEAELLRAQAVTKCLLRNMIKFNCQIFLEMVGDQDVFHLRISKKSSDATTGSSKNEHCA